jgi:hypothetical protein
MMSRVLVGLALLAALPAPALACGGSDYAVLDAPLVPVSQAVDAWLEGYGDMDWEPHPAPVTRFLYGLHGTDPAAYTALEAVLYDAPPDTKSELALPTLAPFQAALSAGDRKAAHDAAAALVEAVLDLPAPLADASAPLLRAPVEYLEIEGKLGTLPAPAVAAYFAGGAPTGALLTQAAAVRGLAPAAAAAILARTPAHPRAASLRWLALRHAMATDIPDGWDYGEIHAAMPAGVGDRLQAQADAWLRDFPTHPLADYVRLATLRVRYLDGDTDAAWSVLLEMYARHPVRVANEARFLVKQGFAPPATLDLAALPPEFASALLADVSLTPVVWDQLWRKAASNAAAPWALPLQERLLWQLSEGNPTGALPPSFAAIAVAPPASPTWGRLVLAVLLREGRVDEAWAQTERLKDDVEFVGPIRAQIRLLRRDWSGALHEPGLPADSQSYLLRVLAPDDVLQGLLADPDAALASEARFNLALRARAAPGGWKAGATLLAPTDPARSALWKRAAKLAAGKKDAQVLAYARFLRSQAGEIFLENTHEDVVWYRALPSWSPDTPPARVAGLPFSTDDELARTAAWLPRAFATHGAFVVYARWLDGLDVSKLDATRYKQAQIALGEADSAYNTLLNYGSSDTYAWGSVLPQSAEAVAVRRVGRALNE